MYVHTYIVLGASTYNATLAAAKCDLRNMSHNVKLSFTVPSLMSERCVFSPPPPLPLSISPLLPTVEQTSGGTLQGTCSPV